MKKLLSIIFLLAIISASCSTPKILSVQDFKKVGGIWVKTGSPYTMPDTIKTIHAFTWISGKHIYPYNK